MPLSRRQTEVANRSVTHATLLQRTTHALLHPPRSPARKKRQRTIELLLPDRSRLKRQLLEFCSMLLMLMVMIAAIVALAVSGALSYAKMIDAEAAGGRPPAGVLADIGVQRRPGRIEPTAGCAHT